MFEYTYENYTLFSGYHFNAITRATAATGVQCKGISLGAKLTFHFAAALTEPQRAALTSLVASGDISLLPSNPPYVIKIRDLWEYRDQIATITGVMPVVYFSREDTVGDESTQSDTIELHFPRALTTKERNDIRTWFSSLIKQV